MQEQIDRILIPKEAIARRVAELADQITRDHSPPVLSEGEVTIVPVLTGAMIFCADLMRRMPIAMKIGLLTVSSYPGKATRSQSPRVTEIRAGDVTGRHVVVVDDILDSGHTLATVVPLLRNAGAASVKTCVLLRKERPAGTIGPPALSHVEPPAASRLQPTVASRVEPDYVGFPIPDEFVVGYGLDYDDYYRNLPDIVTLKRYV